MKNEYRRRHDISVTHVLPNTQHAVYVSINEGQVQNKN